MTVKDVMSKDPIVIRNDQSLKDAATLMRDHAVGSIPVQDGDRLVGMVTDRDIAIRGLAEGLEPANTPVSMVLSDQVLYCFEDQNVDDVIANMAKARVRRLPVKNKDKRLVGIVSLGDLSTPTSSHAIGEAVQVISRPARAA